MWTILAKVPCDHIKLVQNNLRKPNVWFDYQFVRLNKTGGVVGRSEKIIQQVSYTFDCP